MSVGHLELSLEKLSIYSVLLLNEFLVHIGAFQIVRYSIDLCIDLISNHSHNHEHVFNDDK